MAALDGACRMDCSRVDVVQEESPSVLCMGHVSVSGRRWKANLEGGGRMGLGLGVLEAMDDQTSPAGWVLF